MAKEKVTFNIYDTTYKLDLGTTRKLATLIRSYANYDRDIELIKEMKSWRAVKDYPKIRFSKDDKFAIGNALIAAYLKRVMVGDLLSAELDSLPVIVTPKINITKTIPSDDLHIDDIYKKYRARHNKYYTDYHTERLEYWRGEYDKELHNTVMGAHKDLQVRKVDMKPDPSAEGVARHDAQTARANMKIHIAALGMDEKLYFKRLSDEKNLEIIKAEAKRARKNTPRAPKMANYEHEQTLPTEDQIETLLGRIEYNTTYLNGIKQISKDGRRRSNRRAHELQADLARFKEVTGFDVQTWVWLNLEKPKKK